MSEKPKQTLIIACGALAREVKWAIDAGGWDQFKLTCLPAELHYRPQEIPAALERKIEAANATGLYGQILVLYGDCGTAGKLDDVLARHGAERISGAHCYEFFAGAPQFEDMMEEEIGSFFLTDFLVRFFDRLVIKGLGLDRYPHLLDSYFGNYKRLVYLAQMPDEALQAKAKEAAERLGLEYVYRYTGLDTFSEFLHEQA